MNISAKLLQEKTAANYLICPAEALVAADTVGGGAIIVLLSVLLITLRFGDFGFVISLLDLYLT